MNFIRTYCFVALSLCLLFLPLTGCGSYAIPGPGADFNELLGESEFSTQRQPQANFPANLTLLRLQGQGYSSYTYHHRSTGRFTPVTIHEFDPEPHIKQLKRLPMVNSVSTMNRLLIPKCNTEKDARIAAARLQADILLLYTIDTQFFIDDSYKPLSVVSLGLLPTQNARVHSVASALIMDTRSGYIYGTVEASSKSEKVTSGWTSEDDVDRTRMETEQQALDRLMAHVPVAWNELLSKYQPAQVSRKNNE